MTRTSELLSAAKLGDPAAESALFSLLYSDLRRLAHSRLRRSEPCTLLQTTALVQVGLRAGLRPRAFPGLCGERDALHRGGLCA